MKPLIRVMKALSDPNRIKIIKMLGTKELCVCEITSLLGLAQSTVSKHLKLLEDAGLVESCRDGGWVNYRIADGSESPYAQTMIEHMREWLTEHPEIVKISTQLPDISRENLYSKPPNVV